MNSSCPVLTLVFALLLLASSFAYGGNPDVITVALGFSASSRSVFPSIYVGGRAATDPLDAISGPLIITNGTGSQFNSFNRWGDYSSMSIDPTDDCTFWYTKRVLSDHQQLQLAYACGLV